MTKRYIDVAYKDREMAKRLGARWDASVRRWYCPPGSALAKVYGWRKSSGGTLAEPFVGDVMISSAVAANSNIARSTPGSAQLSFLA